MHLLLALLLALPGWEGKVHFQHNPPRKSGGSEGAIHFAPGRVRLEEPTPLGLTVILWDGRSLRILFPERKAYLELPPEQAPLATAPPLGLEGMQKTGDESLDGQSCAIWEHKADVTQRVWVPSPEEPAMPATGGARRAEHPKAKKLFFFLRAVTVTPRGATEAEVSEVRFRDQPAALFRVPKDYRLTSR
jgi:hypothetical protein